jgi:hypothetical protein
MMRGNTVTYAVIATVANDRFVYFGDVGWGANCRSIINSSERFRKVFKPERCYCIHTSLLTQLERVLMHLELACYLNLPFLHPKFTVTLNCWFCTQNVSFPIGVVSLGGVRLSPLGTSTTVGLLYQPRMIDDDNGVVGGMRIGRGNRSTRRKPAPVPLCPPQIPHDLTWDRTRAAAVGSRRLTA